MYNLCLFCSVNSILTEEKVKGNYREAAWEKILKASHATNFLIMVLMKDYSNADIVTERSSGLSYHHFQFTYYNFYIKFLLALFILVRLFHLGLCLLDFASNLSDSSGIYDSIPGEELQCPITFVIRIFMFSSFIQTYASYCKIVRAAAWNDPNLLYKYPERKNLELKVLQLIIRR